MVVIAGAEVIRVILQLSEKDHVVRDKGEEDRAARLADAPCLGNAALPVLLAVQMVQRAEEQNDVERGVRPERQVDGIALPQLHAVVRGQLLPKGFDVAVGKLHGADIIAVFRKIQAVFARTRADVRDAVAGLQILLDEMHRREEFYAGGLRAVQADVLVEDLVGLVDLLILIFDLRKLVEVHLKALRRSRRRPSARRRTRPRCPARWRGSAAPFQNRRGRCPAGWQDPAR